MAALGRCTNVGVVGVEWRSCVAEVVQIEHLAGGEDLADKPVQDEAGRHVVKEEQKDDGHHVHHLLLGFVAGVGGDDLLADGGGGHEEGQGVDGVAEEGDAEWQMGDRVREGQVLNPPKGSAPEFDGIAESLVEGEENGDLQQDRQTTAERIHAVFAVKEHLLMLQFARVVLELLLEFVEFWLQFLHALHGVKTLGLQGPGEEFDDDGKNDDGDAIIMGIAIEAFKAVDEDGLGENGEPAEVEDVHVILAAAEAGGEVLELLVGFWAGVEGGVPGGGGAGGQRREKEGGIGGDEAVIGWPARSNIGGGEGRIRDENVGEVFVADGEPDNRAVKSFKSVILTWLDTPQNGLAVRGGEGDVGAADVVAIGRGADMIDAAEPHGAGVGGVYGIWRGVAQREAGMKEIAVGEQVGSAKEDAISDHASETEGVGGGLLDGKERTGQRV